MKQTVSKRNLSVPVFTLLRLLDSEDMLGIHAIYLFHFETLPSLQLTFVLVDILSGLGLSLVLGVYQQISR